MNIFKTKQKFEYFHYFQKKLKTTKKIQKKNNIKKNDILQRRLSIKL